MVRARVVDPAVPGVHGRRRRRARPPPSRSPRGAGTAGASWPWPGEPRPWPPEPRGRGTGGARAERVGDLPTQQGGTQEVQGPRYRPGWPGPRLDGGGSRRRHADRPGDAIDGRREGQRRSTCPVPPRVVRPSRSAPASSSASPMASFPHLGAPADTAGSPPGILPLQSSGGSPPEANRGVGRPWSSTLPISSRAWSTGWGRRPPWCPAPDRLSLHRIGPAGQSPRPLLRGRRHRPRRSHRPAAGQRDRVHRGHAGLLQDPRRAHQRQLSLQVGRTGVPLPGCGAGGPRSFTVDSPAR